MIGSALLHEREITLSDKIVRLLSAGAPGEALRVSVYGGKYTVVMSADGGLRALRYGEEWRDLAGDGLVLALAQEVDDLRAERDRLRADAAGRGEGVKVLRQALERIERWKGEFPETGKFWNGSKEPMSYAAAYGSNGERDFMRGVARDALAAAPAPATDGTGGHSDG